MSSLVRDCLIDRAHHGDTIGYQELADACDLGLNMRLPQDRSYIGQVLGDISTDEHQAGRPLLSAVAVEKRTGKQAQGFYELCEILGLGTAGRLKKAGFGEAQKLACFAFWQDAPHHLTYR